MPAVIFGLSKCNSSMEVNKLTKNPSCIENFDSFLLLLKHFL